MKRIVAIGFAVLTVALAPATRAVDNGWTNSLSAKWESASSWSSGVAPTNGQNIFVTNSVAKTVTIDATTSGSFPNTMTVNNLTLTSVGTATNTLSLSNAGTTTPLLVSGQFYMTNSALQVNSSALRATGQIWLDGMVTVNSGSVSTPSSLVVNGGTTTFSDGTLAFNGGQVMGTLNMTSSVLSNGSSTVYIGHFWNPSSTGRVVTVNGSGINGSVMGTFVVGYYAVGEFAIKSSFYAPIRFDSEGIGWGVGGNGTFTAASRQIIVDSDLRIGSNFGTGTVWVTTDTLYATPCTLFQAGSNRQVYIGAYDGYGSVVISNGYVTFGQTHIASGLGVSQLTMMNGTLSMGAGLTVGDGGSGRFMVSGGTITASSYIIIGGSSYGQMSVSGGTVGIGNLFVSNAGNPGTLTIDGGTVSASQLYAQYPGASRIFLNGGTLSVTTATVSNGAPFVVGTGTNSATLRLSGGIHSYADSLIISTQAMLTGCGTIIGSVLNYGTINNDCGGGTLTFANVVTNNGTIIVTNGVVQFSGGIINSGTIVGIAPSAPSGLTATAISSSQIDLSWTDNSSNEDGFKIERARNSGNSPGTWSQIAIVNSNVTSYSDTGLLRKAKYWYRVKAYNWAGDSVSSGQTNATTFMAPGTLTIAYGSDIIATGTVGGAFSSIPTHIDYILSNIGDSNLSWQSSSPTWLSVSPDGGLLHYQDFVHVAVTINSNIQNIPAGTYSDSLAFINLTNGIGSTNFNVTLIVYPAPISAPTNLVAAAVSTTQIGLSWVDNANNEDGFKVERAAASAGPWSEIVIVSSNLTSYSDTTVTCGQTNFYRVRAYNAATNSDYSNIATANTSTVDADCDGILNSWMVQYFSHQTGQASDNSRANDDADGDGQSNLAEYLTGTDPTNASSAFRVLSLESTNDDVLVTWATAGGRTNVVQSATDLTIGYTNVSPNIILPGSGGTTTNWLDAGAATNGNRYYRVRLVP